MQSFIQRLVKSTRGRVKHRRREQRTEALYDAALRLLAKQDYEKISIAVIAREAGCSVGGFYNRFHDKNAFLQSVISTAFRVLTTESAHDLAPERWRGSPRNKTIDGLVRHIVAQMSRGQAAGVVRAAVKLSMIKPAAAEPFLEYRTTVTDRAVALLATRPSPGTTAVQTAVRIIFATVIDATLPGSGPRHLGTRRMIEALTDLTTAYLRSAYKDPGAADREAESDEVPKPAAELSRIARASPDEPKVRHGLLRPDVKEVATGPDKARAIRARRGSSPGAASPTRVNPRDAKLAKAKEPSPNAKPRFRIL